MRVIKVTPQEADGIVSDSIKMLIRQGGDMIDQNIHFHDIEGKDFILHPDIPHASTIHSPGSIYIYNIFPIQDEEAFRDLQEIHQLPLESFSEDIYAFVLRFRPFKTPVHLEANPSPEMIYDVSLKSAPIESIQLLEDPLSYDPRTIDSVQLVDDLNIILSWNMSDQGKYSGKGKEIAEKVGEISLREIVKRGISLNLKDYSEEEMSFINGILDKVGTHSLFIDYILYNSEDFISPIIYSCQCISCGHVVEVNRDIHCEDIKCPKCGGLMRRMDRPGVGRIDAPNRRQRIFHSGISTNEITYSCQCISCGYEMTSPIHCEDYLCPKCGAQMRRKDRPGLGRGEGYPPGLWNRREKSEGEDFETTNSPPWGSLSHSQKDHPSKSDFIIRRGDKWSDWKLPYKYHGKIHCGGVRAALSAAGGARQKGGTKMSLTSEERGRLEGAARTCKIGDHEFSSIEDLDVVQRGDEWCVVHGHPQKSEEDKPPGTVIKCFPTKAEAEKMHTAIIISQKEKEKEKMTGVTDIILEQRGDNYLLIDFSNASVISSFTSREEALYEKETLLLRPPSTRYTEDFVSYPYSYIGSKRRIIESIIESIPSDVTFMMDAFAGSGVVSYFSRLHGLDVVGVDVSRLSEIVYNSIISNQGVTLSEDDIEALVTTLPKSGYLSTLSPDILPTMKLDKSTKAMIDGIREMSSTLEPVKRDMTLSVLLTSASQLCWDGILQFGLSQRVKEMISKGEKMVDIFKRNLSNNAQRFNRFVKQEGGKATIIRHELSEVLQNIGEIPPNSAIYLDPPYISEAKEVSYYPRYDTWEHVIFGDSEKDKEGAKWSPKDFLSRMDDLICLSKEKGFKYVIFSYKVNKMFPPAKLEEMFHKYYSEVVTKKVPIKYRLRMKEFDTKQTELIFLLSNESLENVQFLKADFVEDPLDDDVKFPIIKEPKFIMKAITSGRTPYLLIKHQMSSTESEDMVFRLGKDLSKEPTSYVKSRELFSKEIWPILKSELKDVSLSNSLISLHPSSFEDFEKQGYFGNSDKGSSIYMFRLDFGTYEISSTSRDYSSYIYAGNVLKGRYGLNKYTENYSLQKESDIELLDSALLVSKPHDAYFSLQHIKAISEKRSAILSRWNLNLVFGGETYTFQSSSNPLEDECLSILRSIPVKLTQKDGYIPPSHPLSFMTSFTAKVDLLDEGICDVISLSHSELVVDIKGEKIKGQFTFIKEDNKWHIFRDTYLTYESNLFMEDFSVTKKVRRPNGYMELEGIFFREGFFKGRNHSRDIIRNMTLDPIHKGQNLAYINFFHNKDEVSRIGILTEIWWDEEAEWMSPQDGQMHKGAQRFKGIITDKKGIKAVMEDGVYQTSGELAMDCDGEGNPIRDVAVGMAICQSPAVAGAQITQACIDGSCKIFPTSLTPMHL